MHLYELNKFQTKLRIGIKLIRINLLMSKLFTQHYITHMQVNI